MNLQRNLTATVVLAILLGASGCKFPGKRKPNLPTQASAPTIQPQPATNQPGPPPPVTGEPARPMPTPGESIASDSQPKPLPKPKTHVTKKTVPPPPVAPEPQQKASTTPSREPNLTASLSQADALHRKLDTAQLIEATETVLRGLNRSLNNNEQATVQHIRSFIKQSQSATTDGDYERAYNLAYKAHLLSDELTKQ
jgi:outer membrane biosynthesis protein TonB